MINYTGVKKRLLITERKVQSEEIDAQISSLESLKRGYEDFINRYPPTNKTGRPVVWKQEITEAVLATQAKINVVNEKIRELKDKRPEIQKFDWLLLSAWLLVPELCLLSAILAFSVAGNRPFKKKKALPSWPN
ncbi:MAG: hypothetical protein GWN55_03135 [Phycisphaerae bacterium]|nr:hypothetical protein [Phycisphaerae bacterium]NIU28759.1 hypothetical protein [candidate division KSB1 bacterium]NIV00322.1 hypothetical protein [Phycisphaerae bacterium]NIV70189.1 hypothetical protein [Phycisphaerae bacterium]NIW17905.1 hypothetical protein [candidate division KSB1 bacterium]